MTRKFTWNSGDTKPDRPGLYVRKEVMARGKEVRTYSIWTGKAWACMATCPQQAAEFMNRPSHWQDDMEWRAFTKSEVLCLD